MNIHLGLSPYYRGAGTNFWPLVNGEPEYCGATIHILDGGVDTGPVIAHVRPEIAAGDGPHDIGNKTIVAAAGALADAAVALDARAAEPRAAAGRRPGLQARRFLGRRRAPAVRQLRARDGCRLPVAPRPSATPALSLVRMEACA